MSERERIIVVLRNLFACFDKDDKRTIPIDDVAHILRYMGQFPPEGELVEVIHKQLIDEAQSRDIPLPVLERVVLRLVADREYEPDYSDTLLEAFRALDGDKLGFITVDRASEVLTAGATGLRERELNEFLRFARDKKDNTRIYYEEYINKLTTCNTRHILRLWSNPN